MLHTSTGISECWKGNAEEGKEWKSFACGKEVDISMVQ